MNKLFLSKVKVILSRQTTVPCYIFPHQQGKGSRFVATSTILVEKSAKLHHTFPSTRLSTMASLSTPAILRVIASSVTVVQRAGQIIRDVMTKGDLGIVEKGKNDLQTEADRSAQHCIIASLSRQYPKMKIIGEETLDPNEKVNEDWIESTCDAEVLKKNCPNEFKNIPEDEIVVWVDPLDGTSEYTQGLLDHVTVLVGIAVKGKAIAGVIYQPFYNYQEKGATLGRTIWGLVGLGAFGHTVARPPADKRIVTTTRSHSNSVVQMAIDALKPDEVVRVGGAGHKVLLLIEGRAHAYIFASPGCKKCDTCAPEAILHSLGGKLTDIHGNDLQYHETVKHANSAGVLATFEAKEHPAYVQSIPQEVRNALVA